jgi:hypothetical protein
MEDDKIPKLIIKYTRTEGRKVLENPEQIT